MIVRELWFKLFKLYCGGPKNYQIQKVLIVVHLDMKLLHINLLTVIDAADETDLNYAPKSLQQDIKEATGGYVCKTKCTKARKLAIEKRVANWDSRTIVGSLSILMDVLSRVTIKGLIESLLDLFPFAENRNCVRHLYSNFKNDGGYKGKTLKAALWKAARTTTVRNYEKTMAEMRRISEGAHNWLQSKGLMIIDARDKPILTMMEIIRTKMMQRIPKKAEAAQKYIGLLCPKIQKNVDTLIEQAARCWPSHDGALRYEVAFGPSDQHVVDLEAGRRLENYVDSCYHMTTQISLYSNYIFPIRGANQWEQVPEMESLPILPPIQRRPTGRPKKKRRKATDEQDNGPSRGHRTLEIKCNKCGKPSHNIRSCRDQVRGNSRLNTHLSSATSASPTPPPEPSSSTVPPPTTAPSTFLIVALTTTTPLARIIPKLPFKRHTQTIQVPSHSTPTMQRRKIKVAAGRQHSQVQPTQHQPTPYQLVRWMMQSTPFDNYYAIMSNKAAGWWLRA
ncbi:hypothetical protein GQ457_14G014200 [Hibiscus cannabinus]